MRLENGRFNGEHLRMETKLILLEFDEYDSQIRDHWPNCRDIMVQKLIST
jgi:hypothetical protein